MSVEVNDNVTLIRGKLSNQTGADPICVYVDGEELVGLLEDVLEKEVTVRYWISSNELRTVEEADLQTLEQVSGFLDAETNHRYSDITGYLYSTEHFKVGGHDLIPIFEDAEKSYLLLEVTVHETTD